jgi:hypothetical protein
MAGRTDRRESNGYEMRTNLSWTGVGAVIVATLSGTLQAQPASPPAPAATNAPLVPKIQFATPVHDFGKVQMNHPVKHDFVFTNTGQAVLEVTAVHPGCGCTTAGDWTRRVEPGKTGIIPIQFNATGPAGPFGKAITVSCNDPGQPTVSLQFTGVLWNPVEVIPAYAVFNVTEEAVSNATSIVRVISHEEAPLTLSPPESNSPRFAAEIRAKQPGKEFEVVVRPVPPLSGQSAQGLITIKTSSTNLPVVNINTVAVLVPTLAVNPPSITLPPPPNTNHIRPVVYVRNNGPTPFRLSDPTVNASGVDVQIKEIEPGRYATLTLTFPEDFTIPSGRTVQLTVKTGLPGHPTFEVPVFQIPAQIPPPVPPVPGA